MKIAVDREALNTGLQQVLNGVQLRATLPVMNNVLLEASEGKLFFSTVNMDYAMRCGISAEVNESGRITLPARKLATIVKSLVHHSVELETLTSGTQLKLSSGGATFRLLGMGAEEFPAMVDLSGGQSFAIACDELLHMIHSVDYAQSTDEHRHILNGIYCTFSEGNFLLVATDGRRLATISHSLETRSGAFILPAKTVAEISRLLSGGERVQMSFNERQVSFEVIHGEKGEKGLLGSTYLISKLVEGNYPNYRQVIPASSLARLRISRELFIGALQRAAIIAGDRAPSVRFKLSENLLEIFASSGEFGDSHERVPVALDLADSVEIVFNPRYLLEPLRALSDGEVFFEFRDAMSPGVLRNNESFLCVVMPLRISC